MNHANFECNDGTIINKATRLCDGVTDCLGTYSKYCNLCGSNNVDIYSAIKYPILNAEGARDVKHIWVTAVFILYNDNFLL